MNKNSLENYIITKFINELNISFNNGNSDAGVKLGDLYKNGSYNYLYIIY